MPEDPTENLFEAIDERRDELVELTRALIRFPTVNPPGEAYRPCAEFIGDRLRARGSPWTMCTRRARRRQ